MLTFLNLHIGHLVVQLIHFKTVLALPQPWQSVMTVAPVDVSIYFEVFPPFNWCLACWLTLLPPSRGHLYSFGTQSIPTQLTLTWFWGFTPNKQPFFRVSHIDCLHQQLGGEWVKVVILLRHFWLHLLYFISHFSSETVTFHAMC